MRLVVAVALLGACSAGSFPEPIELEANVGAFDVRGDDVYWAATEDGDVVIRRHSANSSGQVWRRSLDGRTVVQLVAGDDGLIVAERDGSRDCLRLTWIHRDRSSEELPLLAGGADCPVYVRDVANGAVIYDVVDATLRLRRLDLETRAVDTWLDLGTAQFSTEVHDDGAAFAFLFTSDATHLVHFSYSDRSALQTVAAEIQGQTLSLVASQDALYWLQPGWAELPTRVFRVPRDGTSPPEPVFVSERGVDGAQPLQVDTIAWVDEPLWRAGAALWMTVRNERALYRLDTDGTASPTVVDYTPMWIVAYDGQLLVLVDDLLGGVRMLLQPLP